jgi:polyhydroxyalkanoate synthesis regulator phasin
MAQKDLLNRSLDAGREAGGRAQEHIEGLLDDLTRAAQEQRDQVAQIAQDLFDKSQKSSEQILKAMDREVRVQISHLGLATKADIRRLEKKIEALQKDRATAKKAAKSSAKKTGKQAATKKTAKQAAKKSTEKSTEESVTGAAAAASAD